MVEYDVPLTSEQAFQYVSLGNEKKQEEFLNEIIDIDQDIKKSIRRNLKLTIQDRISREIPTEIVELCLLG